MEATEHQAAPLTRSAAQRLLTKAGGASGGRGENCERSPFADLSGPLQSIARPSALAQLADRVAAGAMITLVGQHLGKNISRARHDEICSAYWRTIDNIEATRGRLH